MIILALILAVSNVILIVSFPIFAIMNVNSQCSREEEEEERKRKRKEEKHNV